VLPFGRLWYDGPNAASNAIGYASQYSRAHDAVVRVYEVSRVKKTHSVKRDPALYSTSKAQCSFHREANSNDSVFNARGKQRDPKPPCESTMPDDALPRGYLDASRSMTPFLSTPFVLDRADRSHF